MKRNDFLFSIIREPFFIDPSVAVTLGQNLKEALNPSNSTAREKLSVRMFSDNRGMWEEDYNEDTGEPMNATKIPEKRIAILPIHGVMLKFGTMCTYGTQELSIVLSNLINDPDVIGIILDIDTPGGEVKSIQPLLDEISRSKKPIITYADACLSAGYFVASTTRHIMASGKLSPLFGSIGVMISFADMKPFYEKDGVVFHEIYPPESDWKNKAFNLALEGKYDMIIEEYLTPLAIQFQDTVKKNRRKLDMKTAGIINGRTFMSDVALANGLIDSIGTMSDAVNEVLRIVEFEKFTNN